MKKEKVLQQQEPQNTSLLTSHVSGHFVFQQAKKDTGSFALNASIAEVINGTFKEGILQDFQLFGEIALNYVSNPSINRKLPVGINLKINNPAGKFAKVVINQAFEEEVDLGDFKIGSPFISSRFLLLLNIQLRIHWHLLLFIQIKILNRIKLVSS